VEKGFLAIAKSFKKKTDSTLCWDLRDLKKMLKMQNSLDNLSDIMTMPLFLLL